MLCFFFHEVIIKEYDIAFLVESQIFSSAILSTKMRQCN